MNTRNSYGRNQYQAQRYNNTGTFVPAAQTNSYEQTQPSQVQDNTWAPEPPAPQPQQQLQQAYVQQQKTAAVEQPPKIESVNIDDSFNQGSENGSENKKKWLKKGFKVSMREKRRRQNKKLRKLLTPKNALMVLNELTPGSQHECTMLSETDQYGAASKQYVAVLNVGGIEYKGVGSSKLQAKNNAAEPVIRDMIMKQMGSLPEATQNDNDKMDTTEEDSTEEQSFPMIQLASYALHKLFSDWQQEGYSVPQLGNNKVGPVVDKETVGHVPMAPKPPKKPPVLPSNAAYIHPCMLLSQMKGSLVYSFLACEGVKPNSQIFTMGVNVDGTTYIGKAPNKKEARKMAARKACEEIYSVVYPEEDKNVSIEDM